ncbi:MAG: hypothetical protein FRX49_10630 [Trebouxia sp. A1-2]|nr:MAG: hypothetical protein FRX49_10630 [Trebouxia sp. A1-2]
MVVNPKEIGWNNVLSKPLAGPNQSKLLQRAGHTATAVGADIYVIGGKTAAKGGRMQFCSDICKLDTAASKWSTGFLRPPFGEKTYHTATHIGVDIWVIGGADDKHSSAQVYVLNTKTLKWRTVAFRQVKYCVAGSKRVDRLTVEQVQPHGSLPTARAYHTFNTMGNKCFVVGGRTTQNTLLAGDQLLCMYDAATNQWMSPGPVSGSFPARSSHRGVVIGGNQLVICGGTGQGKLRMNDTSVLKQASKGHLSWRCLSVSPFQPGRTAQGMTVCNDSLYILGGYGIGQSFPPDVWSLPLGAVTGADARQRPVQPHSLDLAVEDPPARCEATCWRTAKRGRAKGSTDAGPASKRQHALAPAGAVDTAQVPGCQAMQPTRDTMTALPPLHAQSNAALPQAAADRNVSGACAMLPASAAALYGGCAFNDAAAMSATVSRLEGDLARAKAALTERLATEDIQLRQRRDLEAEVTRLHAEVAAAGLRCTTSTHQCAQLQRVSEERLQQLQCAEAATADASSRAAAAVATNGDLQRQLSGATQQRDDLSRLVTERHAPVTARTMPSPQAEPCAAVESVWHLTQCREEASKAAEADAVKARSMVRQERLDWEKADADSRCALHSLREEWRMLQDTNAHLHATVTRLTKSLEVAQDKVSEGVNVLAEVRKRAGEEREQSSKAVQAQQAATQAAEHQLQTAQARIGTAETAHKKLEAELSQLRPHAADLEQQLSQCQVKLKAAQADVTDLRAEALHSKEFYAESNKGLEREGQHLADHCNELLKIVAQRRSHSSSLAQG